MSETISKTVKVVEDVSKGALGFLTEKGGASSMRLVLILVTITIMYVWARLSISASTMQPFNMTHVLMMAAAIGGKDLQKFAEVKKFIAELMANGQAAKKSAKE